MPVAKTQSVKVVVDKDALSDYIHDYHHNNAHGRCKADGQQWPCKVYSALYYAVHNKEPYND